MSQASLRRNIDTASEIDWTYDMPISLEFKKRSNDEIRSIFSDDVWILSAVERKATATRTTLSFRSYPVGFRDSAKRIAWCMLNIKLPIELITRPNGARTRLSVGSVVWIMTVEMLPFIQWLDQQGVREIRNVTDDLLQHYSETIAVSAISRHYKAKRLWGPTRFWLYSRYLPPVDRLVQPPWEKMGADDILGPANWSGENATPPIHPQTMSPLIWWAQMIVSEFSGSVLEAVREKNHLLSRLRENIREGDYERLERFLYGLDIEGKKAPGYFSNLGLVVGRQYIAAAADVGLHCVQKWLDQRDKKNIKIELGCPLRVKPTFSVNGALVINTIGYYEVDEYRRIIATACLVVIAYLSGMRGEECRGLTRGCCKPIKNDDGTQRYEVRARSYKDALDVEGNTIKGGTFREEPWHVIKPVADAIHILEALHEQEHLFERGAFWKMARERKMRALDSHDITKQIDQLIEWCNGVCKRLGVPELYIPPDPDGSIMLRRFRRTLAWFIYRQPGGRISLGIQYGHLRGYTSDGYGSRTVTGLRDVFPMEEAFARAETLEVASDRLSQGEGVSGPSVARYLAGVQEFAAEFGGKYLTVRQAARLLRDPALRIFDNGLQPVACCYDASQALCHPDRERRNEAIATPDLTRCNVRCPNVARTDRHIEMLRSEISWEKEQSASAIVPEPLRIRHRQRADTLNAIVLKHEQTRLTIKDL